MKMNWGIISHGLIFAVIVGILTINYTPVRADTTVVETEGNNSRDTANAVSVNTKITGTISGSADEDWFVFTTPSDGYFTFDLTSNDSTKSVYLYDASLNEVTSVTYKSSIHSRRVNYEKNTTFYIRVTRGYYYDYGDYELT